MSRINSRFYIFKQFEATNQISLKSPTTSLLLPSIANICTDPVYPPWCFQIESRQVENLDQKRSRTSTTIYGAFFNQYIYISHLLIYCDIESWGKHLILRSSKLFKPCCKSAIVCKLPSAMINCRRNLRELFNKESPSLYPCNHWIVFDLHQEINCSTFLTFSWPLRFLYK